MTKAYRNARLYGQALSACLVAYGCSDVPVHIWGAGAAKARGYPDAPAVSAEMCGLDLLGGETIELEGFPIDLSKYGYESEGLTVEPFSCYLVSFYE